MSTNELTTRQAQPGSRVPGVVPGQATRVASWVGWHLFEITGVSVPAVLAVTVTPWWWLVSGVVGAGWSVQAVRVARQQAAIRSGEKVVRRNDISGDATLPASLRHDESPAATEDVADESALVDGDDQRRHQRRTFGGAR